MFPKEVGRGHLKPNNPHEGHMLFDNCFKYDNHDKLEINFTLA